MPGIATLNDAVNAWIDGDSTALEPLIPQAADPFPSFQTCARKWFPRLSSKSAAKTLRIYQSDYHLLEPDFAPNSMDEFLSHVSIGISTTALALWSRGEPALLSELYPSPESPPDLEALIRQLSPDSADLDSLRESINRSLVTLILDGVDPGAAGKWPLVRWSKEVLQRIVLPDYYEPTHRAIRAWLKGDPALLEARFENFGPLLNFEDEVKEWLPLTEGIGHVRKSYHPDRLEWRHLFLGHQLDSSGDSGEEALERAESEAARSIPEQLEEKDDRDEDRDEEPEGDLFEVLTRRTAEAHHHSNEEGLKPETDEPQDPVGDGKAPGEISQASEEEIDRLIIDEACESLVRDFSLSELVQIVNENGHSILLDWSANSWTEYILNSWAKGPEGPLRTRLCMLVNSYYLQGRPETRPRKDIADEGDSDDEETIWEEIVSKPPRLQVWWNENQDNPSYRGADLDGTVTDLQRNILNAQGIRKPYDPAYEGEDGKRARALLGKEGWFMDTLTSWRLRPRLDEESGGWISDPEFRGISLNDSNRGSGDDDDSLLEIPFDDPVEAKATMRAVLQAFLRGIECGKPAMVHALFARDSNPPEIEEVRKLIGAAKLDFDRLAMDFLGERACLLRSIDPDLDLWVEVLPEQVGNEEDLDWRVLRLSINRHAAGYIAPEERAFQWLANSEGTGGGVDSARLAYESLATEVGRTAKLDVASRRAKSRALKRYFVCLAAQPELRGHFLSGGAHWVALAYLLDQDYTKKRTQPWEEAAGHGVDLIVANGVEWAIQEPSPKILELIPQSHKQTSLNDLQSVIEKNEHDKIFEAVKEHIGHGCVSKSLEVFPGSADGPTYYLVRLALQKFYQEFLGTRKSLSEVHRPIEWRI